MFICEYFVQRFRMMRSPNRFLFKLIIKEIWIWVKENYVHYYYFSRAERKRKSDKRKFLEPHMQVLGDVNFLSRVQIYKLSLL